MTTEHVSVPRELIDKYRALIKAGKALRNSIVETRGIRAMDEHDAAISESEAILSRATPSDEDLKKWLSDPETVLVWMLRGIIAVPSHKAMADRFWNGEFSDEKDKPSEPRVVTDAINSVYAAAEVDDVALTVYPRSKRAYAMLRFLAQRIREASLPVARVPDGEVRLWDTQWMNIVNHDNCYRDWSKDDAVAHAVKMTERAIARNVADGKLPPKKTATAPQAGETK